MNHQNGAQGSPDLWVWASWDASITYSQMGQIEQTAYTEYIGAENIVTRGVKYTLAFDSMMRPNSLQAFGR